MRRKYPAARGASVCEAHGPSQRQLFTLIRPLRCLLNTYKHSPDHKPCGKSGEKTVGTPELLVIRINCLALGEGQDRTPGHILQNLTASV